MLLPRIIERIKKKLGVGVKFEPVFFSRERQRLEKKITTATRGILEVADRSIPFSSRAM